MHSHYQVLGVDKQAKADEITSGYRNAISEVLPKYSLFPTSVLTIDKFRVVQDAYECLIKPESRAEYDAALREREAEEQSLFGERKARRLIKDEEKKKVQTLPPPYVWNQDTNAPLFWNPGRKLIEGPKDDAEPEAAPVAYFKRSSLDKQLIRVSTDAPAPPPPPPPAPKKIESSPPPKYTPRPLAAPTPSYQRDPPKHQSIPMMPAVPYFSQKYNSYAYTQAWSPPAVDYFSFYQAQEEEERHKRQVQYEREKAQHELEKQKRKVEKAVQSELESRRRLVEKEREAAAQQAERLRAREERERIKSQKKVRWGATDISIEPMNPAYHMVETGPYTADWFFEPEPVRSRHNVLKKRRMYA